MPATVSNHINKTPVICGGDARISGTRIPVWLLANKKRLGMSDAEIFATIPSLGSIELETALQYAAANPDEIDRAIRLNEEGQDGLVE